MCRHLAYVGPEIRIGELLTFGPRGLYEQSWAPRLQKYGTVNADGFGIGWFPPIAGIAGDGRRHRDYLPEPGVESPALYRRAVPIWTDQNLPDLVRTIRSTSIVAAVRSASPHTSLGESAAAPFRHDGFLFSHNGFVPDWWRLPNDVPREELTGLEAHSDSALLWAMIWGLLREGVEAELALRTVIDRTVAFQPDARLNFLVHDGRTIWASRHGDTLFHRSGPGFALVASEPCDDFEWTEVPDRSFLTATRDGVRITERPPLS